MIWRCGPWLLLLSLLLGCTIQPAPAALPQAATATPAPGAAQADPAPPATTPPVAAPGQDGAPAETSSWTIALEDEPGNLFPFSPDGRAAAPVLHAILPAPVLEHNYTYTTTGVLERLPTLDNGDVQLQEISGFLDETGQFTLTETTQPTTTRQLVVTFHWNPALRWADGTPLTAADSVFSYELFGQIEAPAEASAIRAMLERYELVDEHTTRAIFKPGRVEPAYLHAAWPPLPRHRLADLPADQALETFRREPLGYGPYTFAFQEPGRLVLQRNDYWPAAQRMPAQLIFRFVGSAEGVRSAVVGGEADVGVLERISGDLFRFLEQDRQTEAARVITLAGPIYEHLDLNLDQSWLQDIRVRRALAHAIDRHALSEQLFGGLVAPLHSWILPEQRAFYAGDEQLRRYDYDPARANALLEEAGFTDHNGDGLRDLPSGEPFTATLLTSDTPLRTAMAEQIAGNLRAVGINSQVQTQPLDQFYSRTGPLYRRSFELALFAWIANADPDGLALWSCNAVPKAENGFTGNNFSGWCFEEAEWALRRATSTLDTTARARDYLKHQQLWSQEVPVIALLQRPIVVLHRPTLTGVAPDPLAPITWNLEQWSHVP